MPAKLRMVADGLANRDGKLVLNDDSCCVGCDWCRDDIAPLAWRVVIDDIKNFEEEESCSSCTLFNATYIVPFRPSPPGPEDCDWYSQNFSDYCECDPGDTRYINVSVGAPFSIYGSYYSVGFHPCGAGVIAWKVNLPTDGSLTLPICVCADEVVLENWVISATECDGTDSTCTLTSL